MTTLRPNQSNQPKKPSAKTLDGRPPQGTPETAASSVQEKDQLKLSSAPKAPSAGEPWDRISLPNTGEAPGREIDVTQSNRDVTLGYQFNEQTRLSGRYIFNSPTMMNGAALLKVDHALDQNTHLFGGFGSLSGFFRKEVGTNETVSTPTVAAFLGLTDKRGKSWEFDNGARLDVTAKTFTAVTAAYNQAIQGFDRALSAGLSKATVTGEATLSKNFDGLEASVGYGHHLDVGMIGTYYATGGGGLFPMTHYLQAGLKKDVGAVSLSANGYLPIAARRATSPPSPSCSWE